jgi:hypothetical protein
LCLLTHSFSCPAFLGTVGVYFSGTLINMLRVSLTDLWIDSHFRYVEPREDGGAYRAKGSLWLGIGGGLTDIGTIGPYLPSVRVGVLRVNVTDLPNRVEYTGKISQQSHIPCRVYTVRYCRRIGTRNLEWSSYPGNHRMRNLLTGLYRSVCLSRSRDRGQSKHECTWYCSHDVGVHNQQRADRWSIRRTKNKPRFVSLTSHFGLDGWTKQVRSR